MVRRVGDRLFQEAALGQGGLLIIGHCSRRNTGVKKHGKNIEHVHCATGNVTAITHRNELCYIDIAEHRCYK